ncbi:MAG: ribose 5-phosphate isomerase B [Bacteroidales bacterium]|jgi:ribose 5-phosphate isomerase B
MIMSSKRQKVAIASDHAGYELKRTVTEFLLKENHEIKDFGTDSIDSCDYPDFAHPLAEAVSDGSYDFGIVICGSGNGVNMTVNKHQKIRGALCWGPKLAFFARAHNNANVLALPSRFISPAEAILITKIFLETAFEGGRHQNRVDKIISCNI